jgi:hypothetical protein
VIRHLERFRHCPEPPLPDIDRDLRSIEQMERPARPVTGGDQDRPVRFLDVADRDRSRQSRPPTPGRDPGDLSLEDEVVADVVRRQRARCQDLPSVWVDGA